MTESTFAEVSSLFHGHSAAMKTRMAAEEYRFVLFHALHRCRVHRVRPSRIATSQCNAFRPRSRHAIACFQLSGGRARRIGSCTMTGKYIEGDIAQRRSDWKWQGEEDEDVHGMNHSSLSRASAQVSRKVDLCCVSVPGTRRQGGNRFQGCRLVLGIGNGESARFCSQRRGLP